MQPLSFDNDPPLSLNRPPTCALGVTSTRIGGSIGHTPRLVTLSGLGVIASLKVLATEQPTMIPLGAGVQLPASPTGDTVVIDIGSGVQAEKPRAEAIEILENRISLPDCIAPVRLLILVN